VVTAACVLILFAAIAALMGWLPLTPRNDLLRSLQRLERSTNLIDVPPGGGSANILHSLG